MCIIYKNKGMKNIELSDEEKIEQLEMLEKEGLRARIANLIQPAWHVLSLNRSHLSFNQSDIDLAEKQIAIILFLSEKIDKTKQL